ncbi:hypothetical protein BH24ACT5_BH24ACT5_11650 [soil metagenome]
MILARRDRNRSDDPKPLGAVVESLVESLHGGRAGPSSRAVGGVFGRWEEVVGPDVARQVRPVRLEADRLVVEVGDPAWATQVRLLADHLRSRLSTVTGVEVATVDVRVSGGGNRGRRSVNRPDSA